MTELRYLPPASRFFKKLKDRKLKAIFEDALNKIAQDYTIGELKTGELKGVYCYDVFYNKTNYEIAYAVREVEGEIVIVIMAGTRENFYNELKRYWT